MILTGSSKPRSRLHGGNHHRGACHIAFHVFHRCAGLETQPSGVKSDPFPDQGDGRHLPASTIIKTTKEGGLSEPAATPSRPPNLSSRIRASSQT